MPGPGDLPEKETAVGHQHRSNGCDGFLFAFASLEQLQHWFPCPIGRAAMCGYQVLVVDVPDQNVFVGTAQVIYRAGLGRVVDRLNCETFKSEGEW